MPDREKVLAQCEWAIKQPSPTIIEAKRFYEEVLALLKEQEPVEIDLEGGGNSWWYVCEECRGLVDKGDRFCRHCGRPLKK